MFGLAVSLSLGWAVYWLFFNWGIGETVPVIDRVAFILFAMIMGGIAGWRMMQFIECAGWIDTPGHSCVLDR